MDISYNEVQYSKDLSTLKSITGFLALKEKSTGKTLASVFATSDSTDSLASWSVLLGLMDDLVRKLNDEILKSPLVLNSESAPQSRPAVQQTSPPGAPLQNPPPAQ